MTLCFGVYATILKSAASDSVMNRELVSRLVGTIDPDHLYGDGGHDDAVSKLMSGTGNFPKSERSESFGAIREFSGSTTSIIPKSHTVDSEELAAAFESDILPLLNEDRKAATIGALQYVVKNDETLRVTNIRTFEKCVGMDFDASISTKAQIVLPRFLAGLFLYILSINRNDKDAVKVVRQNGFLESFHNTLVDYTNKAVPGFTVAPDDCSDYLERVGKKYDRISTLIFKGVPHPFYELYVPGSLMYGEKVIEKAGVREILSIGRYIIFTGTGGQGKSMLMRHLLLDAIHHYPETGLMPIFISVKDFDGSVPDILQCSHVFIRNLWPELSMDELQTMFIDGKVLLLFDGLDEIKPALLATFTSALNDFQDRYCDNAIVLSSRPYDNFSSFSRCESLSLLPLTKPQALEMVEKLQYPDPETNKEFRTKLDAGLYEEHRGYSDNPLLLSIMLLTYEEYKEVPSKVHRFYQTAYQVLSRLHDESKNLDRPLATGWNQSTFADYFSYFCSITYQKALTNFTYDSMSKFFSSVKKHYRLDSVDVESFIKDLCDNICLMTFDGRTYDFIHRSFQEYFCARFLYHQDKEKLEAVIPLFDRRDKTRDDDKTLMMLYDMEPEEVTNYMFVPFLRDLINDCESKDGVWTFLERIYGHLECADGDMTGKARTAPDSRLYSFISDQYDIRQTPPSPAEFPALSDEALEVYVYYEGKRESLRRIMAYAHALSKPPVVTGRLYHFDWDDLKESEIGRGAVESPDSPFVREYEAVKELYKRLAADIQDAPDVFADMF